MTQKPLIRVIQICINLCVSKTVTLTFIYSLTVFLLFRYKASRYVVTTGPKYPVIGH